MGEQTLKRTVSAAIMLLLTLIFMIGALISYRSGDGVSIRAHSADRAEIMRGGDGEDAALPASVLPGELVNINIASAAELMRLPGIGEVLGERIVSYRQAHGGFKTIEEIMEVDGIGEGKFAAISGYITVQEAGDGGSQ